MTEITGHHKSAQLAVQALSPLLSAVVLAEEISRDIAGRQADHAPLQLRNALRRQSLQEAAHALMFRAALAWLPGPGGCPALLRDALLRYRVQLDDDVARGRLDISLVGLQCVLESLGAVVLQPPSGQLCGLADRFLPAWALVLHQEQSHQKLGQVWVARFGLAEDELDQALGLYVALARDVLRAGLATLECLQEERSHYEHAVPAELERVSTLLRAQALVEERRHA